MAISISAQTETFLAAMLLGLLTGVGYDVLRVCRKVIVHGWLMLLAEDFLFFTATALLLFCYFLERCRGEVRLYVMVGLLLGWVLYYFTAGSLVMAITVRFLAFVGAVLHQLAIPIGKFAGIIKKLLITAVKPLLLQKNRLKSHASMLYNNHIHSTAKGGNRRWHLQAQELKKKKKKSIPRSMD
ncbi:MAG: spore cortex biosynthesis protein YabQ [Angelakisella sp.]